MTVSTLGELTWEEVRDLDRDRTVAILPVGAIEAHGPHLPLATDGIIAGAMARAGAELLAAEGYRAMLLPAIEYTSASFAADFPGTLPMQPETVTRLVADIGRGLARHGFGSLALANAHLDPVHLGSLRHAVDVLKEEEEAIQVVFPDVSRKPWALRLTDEFKSGACHAGRYEGSVVLAERPDLVRREVAAELPANPVSLSTAIREGKTSFTAAGGSRAYFGDPAAATAGEGEETVAALGAILRDAVIEALEGPGRKPE